MPPLKDVLTKGMPQGYAPVEDKPSTPGVQSADQAQQSSANMRCPLPPTFADADSIRTFEKGSSTPQSRIMPLPPQTGGTGTTTTSGGISSASSSSSGGSTPTPTVSARTASVVVNVPANDATLTRITLSRSFQILSVSATSPCDVRLYGTQATQSSDSSRQIDAPIPGELTQNIILDVILDTVPYFWSTQNIVGLNADNPQGTSVYVTVFNITSTPLSNVSVYITYFPLES
jgi:hypothetical protein